MGVCCSGNKQSKDQIYKKAMEGASKHYQANTDLGFSMSTTTEAAKGEPPQLSNIDIYDVNDLIHDRWQYSLKQNGSQYEEFDNMDKMIISACTIHMEELLEGNFSFDPEVPLSKGRVINLETKKFFIHNKPKALFPIRIFVSKDDKAMAESIGFLGEQMIGEKERSQSLMKKKTVQAKHWEEVGSSWIGSEWQKQNPNQGNPTLNQIKEGLQQVSIDELMETPNMGNNKYAERAKSLRNLVWEIIFSKIQLEEKDKAIPEEVLWVKRDRNRLVRALLQVYYTMAERIDMASNEEDVTQIQTLGPLAYVMVPIAYGVTTRQPLGGGHK